MPRKKIEVLDFWPKGAEPDVPRYSFGAVCELLGLEAWRLQKFLDSPRYRLSASSQHGKGKGSRKWFSTEDVYRIGIARFLANDGLAPKLIAAILRQVDDRDFWTFDEDGQTSIGITLSRGKSGPKVGFFRSGHAPDVKLGGDVYYVLDFDRLITEIDRKIHEVEKQEK